MARPIVVLPSCRLPIERCAIELVEHKGVGHPDSIVDGACEAASRILSHAYLNTYGHILHHNLDKGLLVAGRSRPRFRGGELLEPMKLILCGRATSPGPEMDVHGIVTAAARGYLARAIRCDPQQFEIVTEIREGAANLKEVFARESAVPLANDTSFGCGYAPYSRLDQAVLGLARLLQSDEFRRLFPAAGDDFKIMGRRVDHNLGFTVALAFVDRYVEDAAYYFAVKRQIEEYLSAHLQLPGTIQINTLDDPKANNEDGLYLTVTGLSAEMGDDGQAGRGNRVNGLITPGRVMSLEAAAGKNPVSHVGKIYNVLAMLIARDVHDQIAGVEEVSVQLLSTIGAPVGEPEFAAVEVSAPRELDAALRGRITGIIEDWLGRTGEVTRLILAEQVTLY